jgi:hypothetical protein
LAKARPGKLSRFNLTNSLQHRAFPNLNPKTVACIEDLRR